MLDLQQPLPRLVPLTVSEVHRAVHGAETATEAHRALHGAETATEAHRALPRLVRLTVSEVHRAFHYARTATEARRALHHRVPQTVKRLVQGDACSVVLSERQTHLLT